VIAATSSFSEAVTLLLYKFCSEVIAEDYQALPL
jgi:hypothetical protein